VGQDATPSHSHPRVCNQRPSWPSSPARWPRATVRLGDFGTFNLRVRSVGTETEAAVGAQNITKVVASFRPGKRFRDALDPDVIVFKKA
jgi:hypothetical protein